MTDKSTRRGGADGMPNAETDPEAASLLLTKTAADGANATKTVIGTPKSARGGGKLARSETVTVRLDPKLRYLAELAARKQRRTLSSYIEWAIEDNLKSLFLYSGTGHNGDNNLSVSEEASRLWDVDESERFLRLGIHYPDLLSHQEQEIWKMVQDSLLLCPAQRRIDGRMTWDTPVLEDHVFPAVRSRWFGLVLAYSKGVLGARNDWVEDTKTAVLAGRVFHESVLTIEPEPQRTSKQASSKAFDDMDGIPF